ncbi:hypothetical protein ABVN80_21465 [Acinetobacter baumannii]
MVALIYSNALLGLTVLYSASAQDVDSSVTQAMSWYRLSGHD